MPECPWHPRNPDDDCPECLAEWEARQPDTVKEWLGEA